MRPELPQPGAEHAPIDAADTGIANLLSGREPCDVLLVDDDELVLRRLAAVLKDSDYRVRTARSGEEALQMLDTSTCQIVVTDWHLPDMDGLALCRKLRQRTSSGYIYVLMLTVRDGRGDVLAGLAAGADDYIIKGAAAEEIIARLEVGRRITYLEQSLRRNSLENRRMSVTDPLTGSRNRRFLMKYLPRELERARACGQPIAVLSCDIDHFKGINDRYGHEVGDEILQSFVKCAGDCLRRSTDWVARSGGEEFLIVLTNTTLHDAGRVASRLRDLLNKQPLATSAGAIATTVSIGVTALESLEELATVSDAELLRAADRLLYASKLLGRNRATVAPVRTAKQTTVKQAAVLT